MTFRNLIVWTLLLLSFAGLANHFGFNLSKPETVNYSSFISEVQQGQVLKVTIEGLAINAERLDGSQFTTVRPQIVDNGLMADLLENNVVVEGREPKRPSLLLQLLIATFPLLIFLLVLFYLFNRQTGLGGRNGPLSFGRSKARLVGDDKIKTTFDDVAGIDEAKEEVSEIVEFLSDSAKFQRLGGRIPRGVLLIGSPGTGKTLLAKAIAGEANVPFFSISGSDFVEMFVGVGASRVRDMFEDAKENAPCIVFIDEIDAVGRHRGAGLGGGHDEREQTLNQLLVEMDGFEGDSDVIVIAATNRPDVLDPALLRPGRFDRQVVVGLPDIRGREQIIKVHMKKVNVRDDVDPSIIARGTPGFSGADLANLVNEAALFAAKRKRNKVSMSEFDMARDKLLMGTERRSMVMSEEEKRNTAYHESGHVIVSKLMPEHDPIYKVTIIPRSQALGVTMFLPEEDRYSNSRQSIISRVCSFFGGRVAEEFILGPDGVTTGAANDIERATDIVHKMVTKWGLSESMGPVNYDDSSDELFLGRSAGQPVKHISEETSQRIDKEVRMIIDECYERATKIIHAHEKQLHMMAEALIQYETLSIDQVDEIMDGKPPTPPDDQSANDLPSKEDQFETTNDKSTRAGSYSGDSMPDPAQRQTDN